MKTTIFVTVLLLASAASFVFGARYGVYQHYLMNSSVEAALLTGELEAMRGSNLDLLIQGKEVELDGLLAIYGKFVEVGTPWLFWPTSQVFDHQRYIRKVVIYRKQYPLVTPDPKIRAQAERVINDFTP